VSRKALDQHFCIMAFCMGQEACIGASLKGYDHSHAHNGVGVHLHTSLEAFKELPSTSIRETCAYLLGEPECLSSTASVLRSS
jgi:hypothetical protein